jgi:hypothetical protein
MEKNDFWLVNGWIIALIFLILIMSYFLGFFEAFKHARIECSLGEAFECEDTYVYTGKTSGISTGAENDEIILFSKNVLNEPIYNLSILSPNCYSNIIIEDLDINEKFNYRMQNCANLTVNGFLRSELILRYSVIQNNKTFAISSKGYISNYVNSPEREKTITSLNRSVSDWIRNNVG